MKESLKKFTNNDDINNNSNKTFLERYDGVVWEETNNDANYRFGRIFFNSPQSTTTYEEYNSIVDCSLNIFGVTDEYGVLINVISQQEDNLVLEITEDIDGTTETYTTTITVSNGGENLTIERSNEPNGTEFYNRINLSPCQ